MPNKTYLIEFGCGKRQKITVPDDWKVTFGPAVVAPNRLRGQYEKMPMALRFYESNDKQRAIFSDVKSFRDMSIKIEEERSSTQQKVGYVEVEGTRKQTTFHATTKEWVDPDAEATQDLRRLPMPSDGEMFDAEGE